MAQAMWFILQRAVAALLGLVVVDAFPDCHSPYDVWHAFRAMPAGLQIGMVAITFIVAFAVGETVAYLITALNPWWKSAKHAPTKKETLPGKRMFSVLRRHQAPKRPPEPGGKAPERGKDAA